MHKESAQSVHPVHRKGPKCAEILGNFDKAQTAGQGDLIELIPFVLKSLLETQVYTTNKGHFGDQNYVNLL